MDKDKDKDKDKGGVGGIQIPDDLKESEADILNWLAYKKERGQSYKPKGLEALWGKIRAIPKDKIKDAIDHSMANGWSGLFEKNGIQKGDGLSFEERMKKQKEATAQADRAVNEYFRTGK